MERVAIDDSCIGKRSEARTVLAVMASMTAVHETGPVMIRNLSSRGGLIVCVRPPAVGERIELRRGELQAVGLVVWNDVDRAGLSFEQPIEMAEWMPSAHAGQQVVDGLFQQIKAGSQCAPPAVPESQRLVAPEELAKTAEGLEALADTLSADDDVIERYLTDLQILDIAAQTMHKLAKAT